MAVYENVYLFLLSFYCMGRLGRFENAHYKRGKYNMHSYGVKAGFRRIQTVQRHIKNLTFKCDFFCVRRIEMFNCFSTSLLNLRLLSPREPPGKGPFFSGCKGLEHLRCGCRCRTTRFSPD